MNLKNSQKNHKIAITGMSSLLPGSQNPQQFWETIMKGKDMIRETPESHWRIKDYFDPSGEQDMSLCAKAGGFLDPVLFDPMEFGMPPNALPVTDTVQLLSLIAARDVLNDTASYTQGLVDKKKVSVILGVAAGTEGMENMSAKVHWPEVINVLRNNGIEETLAQKIVQETRDSFTIWNENTFPGLLSNVVAGRIANRFDLGGTNCTMDAACASSFAAIKNAIYELQLGNADMVISGGADALNSVFMYMCFNQTGALSKTGDCRAFDSRGDGTILGEGLAFFTLKRLDDAVAQGDRIYAVLAGMGSSSDGRSKSIYAPASEGQSEAIKRAHELAGTSVEDIELIEAHGTGTVAGDFAEFNGLKLAFGSTQKKQYCAMGSIKSQIGHTKSTAGAASLQKAVLALYNRVIPPTIKVEKPNEKIDINNSPFYLNTLPKPWITHKKTRRAGVSSFGFGGTNFHCIAEEYPSEVRKNHYVPGKELILLSAPDKSVMRGKIEKLDQQLDSQALPNIAKDQHLTFDTDQAHRMALIISSKPDFLTIKKTVLSLLDKDQASFEIPNQVYYSSEGPGKKVAVVCAGQGSQYLDMGRGLLNQFLAALEGYSTGSDLSFDDQKVHEVTYPISTFNEEDRKLQEQKLNDTRWAQPAIGNLTIAHKHLMDSIGLHPAMIGGHSYGELSALYWSGVIQTSHDLISVSRKRGELMAAAAKEKGAMTAVFAGGTDTENLLAQAKSPLEIANYNSPNQTVVTGKLEDIVTFEQFLSEKGQDHKRLPVSTAFHSTLVAGSASEFETYLEGLSFGKPNIYVFGNETGRLYPKSKKSIIGNLSNQLKSPVRFVEEITNMYEEGARVFLEVGPGNHLTNLIKAILDQKEVTSISLDGSKNQCSKDAFWVAVGQLSVAGVPLKLNNLWGRIEPFYQEKKDYSAVAVEITGANYEKPYPFKTGIHTPVRHQMEKNGIPPVLKQADTFSGKGETPKQKKYESEHSIPSLPKSNKEEKPTLEKNMNQNNQLASNQEWMSAFAQIQENMHHSQMEFMRMMMENQKQFMQLSAGLLSSLPQSSTVSTSAFKRLNASLDNNQASQLTAPYPKSSGFVSSSPKGPDGYPKVEKPGPSQQPVAHKQIQNTPVAERGALVEPKEEGKADTTQTVDLQTVENKLLEIVAEKTGYPAELVDLDADLESGLGIDSIKRVQVLSSLQDEFEELKAVDNMQLAKMNSLREILNYSNSHLASNDNGPVDGIEKADSPAKEDSSASSQQSGADMARLEAVLLEIVADKTGYPAELLDLNAPLETGLGIDSIKRVQILSTFQDRFPQLQSVDNTQLAKMNTLSEILSYTSSAFGITGEDTSPEKKKSGSMM